MGLFNKLKDILFEEEELTEEVETVKEPVQTKETPKKEPEEKPISRQVKPEKKVEVVEKREEVDNKSNFDASSERELFRSERNFPFPDFDEEEFNNSLSRPKPKPRPTNVMEYERKKRTEKRTDYGRYEKTEIKETIERKKFKPSPIISPVYGVLNEDYKAEDVKNRDDDNFVDIESVRKKAFETPEVIKENPKTTFYEEEVTLKVKEPTPERETRTQTIDELLEDTSDLMLDLDDRKYNRKSNISYDELDNEIDELMRPIKTREESYRNNEESTQRKDTLKEDFETDTLENDLFDLIDSMYDDRKEGDL